ncbi:hypothetical protein [Bradyrhizobium sp. BWC-3-1]|uniref:hypothetical protein n=1 Tax=Bradyrhizobium sp. BWC-3-1 TaxID=3080012 RepID=UPI00293EE111|nr:hypothetical protein [Bradyrhizobium sp. BWC-3-1]WOH58506.1 hypothetical protein RX329_41575 [Bradyrhizobium sp. BWC-3-1]
MPLADGERPAEGDFWFRVLTSDGYSARGRINHAAFKGRFLGPAQQGRPWDAEASGRLRSLAGTTEEARNHAIQYCKDNNGTFYGYMVPVHGKQIIGAVIEGVRLDVRYTPIQDGDAAHADLTFTGPIPAIKTDEHKKLMMGLQDYFAAVHETQWWMLDDAVASADAPPAEAPPPPGLADVVVRAFRAVLYRDKDKDKK